VWRDFAAAGPARIRRVAIHFGRTRKSTRLPESAWGLSRYTFDALLLDLARRRGASLVSEPAGEVPRIIAAGRPGRVSRRGRRLFGFKAHFEGAQDDAVELFFFRGGYVGVNSIESQRTNVCGLAREDLLAGFGYEYDALPTAFPPLAERLGGLNRVTPWVSTGPLRYKQTFESPAGTYPAGDALSFVDPFTGTGLLAAVRTGTLAGRAAARGEPVERYLAQCRESLRRPFAVAGLVRCALNHGWAEWVAPLAPSGFLFALTRPR
jgi:hypothetical protein